MPPPQPPGHLTVTAEIVANVLDVRVEVGQDVAKGDTLLVVESMKMEIPIEAPRTGTISHVGVAVGDVVQEGDLLIAIQP